MVYIEAALLNAELLAPRTERPITPLLPRDIDTEWQKYRGRIPGSEKDVKRRHSLQQSSAESIEEPASKRLRGYHGLSPVLVDPVDGDNKLSRLLATPAGVDKIESTLPSPRDNGKEPADQLHKTIAEKKADIANAQAEFDARLQTRERDWEKNNEARYQSNGVEGIPWGLFDQRWFQKIAQLTRALTDAQEAAKKLQLELIDREMGTEAALLGSEDWRTEAYPEDTENVWIRSVSRNRIQRWLDALHEVQDEPNPEKLADADWPEVDPWEATELGFGEDLTAIPKPERKARIREWQRVCDETKEKPAAHVLGRSASFSGIGRPPEQHGLWTTTRRSA